MRDAATLELVKLLLSFESQNRDKLAQLLVNLDVESAKFLAGLLEQNREDLSTLIDVMRFRSNVSNRQCLEAVEIVSPNVVLEAPKVARPSVPVYEHFPNTDGLIGRNVLPLQERSFATALSGPGQYTTALQAENLRAELESEIDAPSDLRKEYYYLRNGTKRSFVIGSKLLTHLSRVCVAGNQNKRVFLDALGQKVERSEFSPSSKLKSKTLRREILDFVISIDTSVAARTREVSSQFRQAQH